MESIVDSTSINYWYQQKETARKQKMICTQKPFTQTKSLSQNKSNVNQKQQLIARWKIVNGKLVCQWITV